MERFIVMTAAANMPNSCWGRYGKVAVVETDGKTKPKQDQNHRKTMAKQWQNHGKTTPTQDQDHSKTMAKQSQNHGKTMPKQDQNHGKTRAKQ
jgi:hypothetical protein